MGETPLPEVDYYEPKSAEQIYTSTDQQDVDDQHPPTDEGPVILDTNWEARLNTFTSYEGIHHVYQLASKELPELPDDDRLRPIIDCGAVLTVCGHSWLQLWNKMPHLSTIPPLTPSPRRFRFGDSKVYNSLRYTTVHGCCTGDNSPNRTITSDPAIKVEVVSADIPS